MNIEAIEDIDGDFMNLQSLKIDENWRYWRYWRYWSMDSTDIEDSENQKQVR